MSQIGLNMYEVRCLQVVVMLVILLSVFAICWLPYQITIMYAEYRANKSAEVSIQWTTHDENRDSRSLHEHVMSIDRSPLVNGLIVCHRKVHFKLWCLPTD
jgi:hypothetical protein